MMVAHLLLDAVLPLFVLMASAGAVPSG